MIRIPIALFALQSIWNVACASDNRFDTNTEIVRIRPIRRDFTDPNIVLTIDVELSYTECPGEQRKMIRGDRDFAACILKHKVGDKVPTKITWGPDGKGSYKNRVVQVGECNRKIDPNDDLR